MMALRQGMYVLTEEQFKPYREAYEIVRQQPTAYDVDKVIEALEEHAACYDTSDECCSSCDYCRDYAISRKEAIDIVKRGGIYEES